MGERAPSAYGGPRLPRRRVACLSLILDGAGVVVAETCESAKSAGWAGSSHREARGLSAVEDQYWYRDDQQWYICESQPCPHRHLSFDWTQEEWAGFPAYRKTHPNQSQLIEARLNQPPPAPVARPPRPAVVASRSLPGTQPPSRIPSRVPSRNVTPSESPKLGPSGLPPGLELVRQ